MDSLTFSEIAGSASWFCRVPLAAILSNDVVEVCAEDARKEAGVGVVGVISGTKVEGRTLASSNLLKSRAQVERTSALVPCKVDQKRDCRLGENGSR